MALEDIIKRIIGDAEEEAGIILGQAREQAQGIKAEAERKAQNLTKEVVRQREKKANQDASRILTLGRLEAKKVILASQRRNLDRVFQDRHVKEKLKSKKRIVLPQKEIEEELSAESILIDMRMKLEADIAKILFS